MAEDSTREPTASSDSRDHPVLEVISDDPNVPISPRGPHSGSELPHRSTLVDNDNEDAVSADSPPKAESRPPSESNHSSADDSGCESWYTAPSGDEQEFEQDTHSNDNDDAVDSSNPGDAESLHPSVPTHSTDEDAALSGDEEDLEQDAHTSNKEEGFNKDAQIVASSDEETMPQSQTQPQLRGGANLRVQGGLYGSRNGAPVMDFQSGELTLRNEALTHDQALMLYADQQGSNVHLFANTNGMVIHGGIFSPDMAESRPVGARALADAYANPASADDGLYNPDFPADFEAHFEKKIQEASEAIIHNDKNSTGDSGANASDSNMRPMDIIKASFFPGCDPRQIKIGPNVKFINYVMKR